MADPVRSSTALFPPRRDHPNPVCSVFLIDRLMIIAGLLLIFSILSSKFSARLGLPVMVLFVGVGMLAGSEGIGGLAFENYALAHGIGTIALALILFDGGLRTSLGSIRLVWKPALVLATAGVLATSVVTGLAASLLLGLPLLVGVLLGSIIGSTDAAAVFIVLRGAGLHLRQRVAATLEIESGSNDPMAIFLTVALLEILLGRLEPNIGVAGFFVQQMGVGAIVGISVGLVSVRLINRINLGAAGLYPVLTLACGVAAYGASATLGGSGFLAVYLTGIVIGNRRVVFQRGTLLFHDGLAWTSQIMMFVVLGLLSSPSQLIGVAFEGLLVTCVLILVARPIAVAPILLAFRFTLRETLLVSAVGLKGAVPIVLAIFPLLYGLPDGIVLFNVVFFVVLVSAVTQGWALPVLARRLDLEEEKEPEPPVTLEITSLRDVDADIIEYSLGDSSWAAGRRLSELALPEGAVVALIAREESMIPPRGSTRILPGDHVFVVLRPESRLLVDRVFSRDHGAGHPLPVLVEFPLLGTTTAAELREFYGIELEVEDGCSLERIVRERVGGTPTPGQMIELGGVVVRVREVEGDSIRTLGLAILEAGQQQEEELS